MKNTSLNNISIWFNIINDNNLIINELNNIIWNQSMRSRFTASFGKKYNYSNDEITTSIPFFLNELKRKVDMIIGY